MSSDTRPGFSEASAFCDTVHINKPKVANKSEVVGKCRLESKFISK